MQLRFLLFGPLFLASLLPRESYAADLLYKSVSLKPGCSFSIPRLWEHRVLPDGAVWQAIPVEARQNIVNLRYEKHIGKNVVLDATSSTYRSYASIDGAVAEGVKQQAAAAGVSEFSYTCSGNTVQGGHAKICNMSFKDRGHRLMLKVFFAVAYSDPQTLYGLTGYYTQPHDERVLDRIFSSVVLE